MLWAVTLGSSVGSVASAVRAGLRMLSGRKPTTAPPRLTNGSMAFFPKTDKNELMDGFARSVHLRTDS